MKLLSLIPLVILFGCGGKKEKEITVDTTTLSVQSQLTYGGISKDTVFIHDTIYLDSYLQENKSHIK